MNNKLHILDTTVYCNVLNIPGRSQSHASIITELESLFRAGDTLFLPLATILETGNHIANMTNGRRFQLAERLAEDVRGSIETNVPYHVLVPFSESLLIKCTMDFPTAASAEIGLSDVSIIKHFENAKDKFPNYNVRIWSLDGHLSGYSDF